MGTGWLAWTCLLLAAGSPAPADDIIHMNLRGFQIPIKIEAARQADVKQLLLYLSRDQGLTWEIYGRATPDQKLFNFTSDRDGLYYFSIAVIDQQGRMDPPDPYKAKVGQKICIDTTKPVVKITSAERAGDEVMVNWEIHEERPEWASLRLEYRVGDSPNGQWTPLILEPGERGMKRFRPGLPGNVTLRLSLRDLAGNEGVEEKTLGGGHIDHAVTTTRADVPVPPEGPPAPPISPPPPPAGTTTASGGMPEPPSATLAHSTPAPTRHDPPSSATDMTGSLPTRGSLPALQIVNKRQVKLGFNVGKFGPSGLGTVEVYITTDEGANWQKTAGEPLLDMPVTPMRGAASVPGKITVSLPRDGTIYGFYLVVKSRAGLGKAPPHPGEAPQVRIELDTTAPDAKLMAPRPAPGQSDSLVLTWKAEDRNLASNPISLEWSPNINGPWTFIGDAQLPNTGSYIWAPTAQVPAQVFLKLSVRDLAGNIAVAQTDKPVLIDLAQPIVVEGTVTVEK